MVGFIATSARQSERLVGQGKECTTMKDSSVVWLVLAPFWPLFTLCIGLAGVYALGHM